MSIRARRRGRAALLTSEPPDLARRLLAGDEALFREVIGRFHPSLHRLARAIVGNDATADEVAQETWRAVLRSLPTFAGRSTLRSWVHRVCVNIALERVGEDLRAPLLDAPPVDPDAFDENGCWRAPPVPWINETPETMLLRGEMVDCIRRAVDSLPLRQRAVVVLRDFQGFSGPEACEILGLTEANQRILLHRARQRIRSGCQHHYRAKPTRHAA